MIERLCHACPARPPALSLHMPSRQVRKQMQAIAIERVLGRRDDRAGISSLASL
jgi:hypothetical protein